MATSIPPYKNCTVDGQKIIMEIDHHGEYDKARSCYTIAVYARKSWKSGFKKRHVGGGCWPTGERSTKAFIKKQLSCKTLSNNYRELKKSGRGL